MDGIRTFPSRWAATAALATATAMAIAISIAAPARAASTDISQTPIPVATAALVKPNIMLLMDTSDSMSWTHMPDQVEAVTRKTSVGYKSSRCNALYYDPKKTYPLPRKADKSFFPTPAWPTVRYAGFGDFYVTPDTTTTDLSTSFRAYDNASVQVPGFPDTPKAAYYYTHSSTGDLAHDSDECKTPDTNATRPSNGSGTWTKVVVGTTTGVAPHVDERENFAIWYVYYRTRLAMTKSATSLAFTPLTDTFRVGFVTVQPMLPVATAGVDPDKYIAISDFDATQRSLWFSKLFSQTPFGSSPAREGLARVGRHYAGKDDRINKNMVPDPLQYSCQQNFTIMTTDGYWNTQTETPNGSGLFGGPVREDGVTRIIQADGDYTGPASTVGRHCPESDFVCARPIYDGAIGTEKTEKEAWNQYDKIDCGINTLIKTQFRPERKRSQVTKSFSHVERTTEYWTTTRQQDTATDSQTTRKSWKWKMSTEQHIVTRHQDVKDQYQIFRSVLQSQRSSEQVFETSSQALGRTYRIDKTVARERKQSVQHERTQRQWIEKREQAYLEKRRFFQERQQVSKREYYYVTKLKAAETYEPAAACGPAATHDCKTELVTAPDFVDPTTCALGPNQTARTTQAGTTPFLITECTPGPGSSLRASIANCTVQDSVGPGPAYIRTICEDVLEQAAAPAPLPCANGAIDGNNVRSICTYPAPNNTTTAGGGSCTGDPTSAPAYTVNDGTSAPHIRVTCGYAFTTVDNPATCTAGGTPGGIYTACTKPGATNYDIWVQPGTCSTTPAAPGQTITCGPVDTQFPTAAVEASTCTFTGMVGTAPNNYYQTCATVYSGPYPNLTYVQTCNASTGTTPPYENTECVYPAPHNLTNQAVPLGSCSQQTASAANDWYERACNPVVSTNVPVAAGTCVANNGTAPPYNRVVCNERVETVPPTGPQDPSVCPLGERGFGSNFEIERCAAKPYTATQLGVACTNSVGPGPDYIVTVCGGSDNVFAVQDCSAWGGLGAHSNNAGDTWTCEKPPGPNNASNVAVANCSDQTPTGPNWLTVSCAYTETFASGPDDPAACAAAQANPGPELVQTTCVSAAVATQYVRDCPSTVVAPTGPNWLTRTCSNVPGPNNDPTERRGAQCVVGPSYEPDEIKVTCRHYGPTIDYVAEPSLCAASPAQTPGWTQVSCGPPTPTRADAPSAACSPGNSVDYLDERTSCGPVVVLEDFAPAPPCSTGASGNEFHECRQVALGGPVDDPGCTDSTMAGTPFTVTKCNPRVDTGKQLITRVKRKTTVTLLSGTSVIGVPAVSEAFTSWTPSGVCTAPDVFAGADTQLATPPSDFAPCTGWPCVATRDPGFPGSHDSLADVANYYYKTDLRQSGPYATNDVKPKGLGTEDDHVKHQHMTTFVVGLGVSGSLKYQSDYFTASTGDFAKIRGNTLNWPIWPDPLVDYTNTDNYNNPRSIDDFWHTAVNGRGRYFSANDPSGVVSGLTGALTTIAEQGGSGGADAATSFQPSGANDAVFVSSYRTVAWSGDLQRFGINASSGVLNATNTWSAQARLTQRVKPACDNRKVLLIRPGGKYDDALPGTNLVNFAWNTYTCDSSSNPDQLLTNGLNGTEQAAFSQAAAIAPLYQSNVAPVMTPAQAASAAGSPVVNFLRGQTQHEDYISGTSQHFRKRTGPLGDIINSTPVYVSAPFAMYQDTGYAAFLAANATRAPTVYVGGNDGMLHAFDAVTGDERWAVVPQAVLKEMYRLADTNYKNDHRYFVDGSPIVGDVYDGTNWRTILVGGLNAGGKSYYALDITDPAVPKALWEFGSWSGSAACPSAVGSTSDCNVGLTFGKPVITKIAGTWVALFTSGYSNADGIGYVYAVNAITGELVNKITVDPGSSSPTSPVGLAQLNNFVDNTFVDNTTIRAYGGDLKGNIWRFEFPGFGKALIGTATDGTNPQPITTRPEIAEIGNKPIVFVGTGKLLGSTDVTATPQTQSIYGIVDPLTPGPVHSNLRTALKPLTFTQTGSGATAVRSVRCSATAAECARQTGWFMDLPEAGERVNVDMQLLFGTLVVATNVPNGLACDTGGHSWFNYFDFLSGLPVSGAPLTNTSDPTSGNPSTYLGNALVTGFNLYRLIGAQNNPFYQPSVRMSDTTGRTPSPIYPSPDPKGKRISWREIVQ